MGIPVNHPNFNRIFHFLNQPFWGSPILGNLHIWEFMGISHGDIWIFHAYILNISGKTWILSEYLMVIYSIY